MAATYGYSGEFSSDEEIDRVDQQNERLAKFDSYVQSKGPSKNEIEEAIESIKRLADETNFSIADDLLAGILDHYKTQRGPIVDSTRGLYKKIVLRLVRGIQATNGDSNRNGIISSNNNNQDNNNIIDKRQEHGVASSDEDEPVLPPTTEQRPKFDSRVIGVSSEEAAEPMEIDSMSANGPMRSNKQIDLPDTDEEEKEAEDEESTEDDSNTEESESEELEERSDQLKREVEKLVVTSKSKKPSASAAATKKSPAEPKSKVTPDPSKKPYTRSQRMAASKLNSSSASATSLKSLDAKTSESAFIEKPARNYTLIAATIGSALVVALVAFLFYHYKKIYLN